MYYFIINNIGSYCTIENDAANGNNSLTEHRNKGGYQHKKNRLSICFAIIAIKLFIILHIPIIIIGIINILLVSDYTRVETEYLLLPINGSYEFTEFPSQWSDIFQYSPTKFSFSNANAMDDEVAVQFIIKGSYNNEWWPYTVQGMCDLGKNNTATNGNCSIIRHWTEEDPQLDDDSSSSTISCSSILGKRSFLVWQWFTFEAHKKSDLNLNADCTLRKLDNYYEWCDADYNPVHSIVHDRTPGTTIVVIRFCTEDNNDIDAVKYEAQFYEIRSVITDTPFLEYTMTLSMDSEINNVIVPPVGYFTDFDITIEVVGNDLKPVEIQSRVESSDYHHTVFSRAVNCIVCTIIVVVVNLAIFFSSCFAFFKYTNY